MPTSSSSMQGPQHQLPCPTEGSCCSVSVSSLQAGHACAPSCFSLISSRLETLSLSIQHPASMRVLRSCVAYLAIYSPGVQPMHGLRTGCWLSVQMLSTLPQRCLQISSRHEGTYTGRSVWRPSKNCAAPFQPQAVHSEIMQPQPTSVQQGLAGCSSPSPQACTMPDVHGGARPCCKWQTCAFRVQHPVILTGGRVVL
jgi:hypothetical protein